MRFNPLEKSEVIIIMRKGTCRKSHGETERYVSRTEEEFADRMKLFHAVQICRLCTMCVRCEK